MPPRPDLPPHPLPADKELVLKVIPMPADVNANGDIFGGWVMAQVDLAGSVLPSRLGQSRMVTVAVNEFIFKQPVRVGDILSFYSSVQRVGRTDRKSTRLNSSHANISYAVFCLKKKKNKFLCVCSTRLRESQMSC